MSLSDTEKELMEVDDRNSGDGEYPFVTASLTILFSRNGRCNDDGDPVKSSSEYGPSGIS